MFMGNTGNFTYSVMQSDENSFFAEMSSWTALEMKNAFQSKNKKSKYFGILIMKILNSRVIEENAY